MGAYDDVFVALDAAGVRYVVVGGVAVVLRGHARLTVDLDLVVDLAEEAAHATVDALLSLGLLPRLPVDPHEFADAAKRRDWIDNRNLQVFSFYDPGNPLREVDVFAEHPLAFDELHADASAVMLGGVRVPVASVAHLILMKRSAGRPQDLEDIAALMALPKQANGD